MGIDELIEVIDSVDKASNQVRDIIPIEDWIDDPYYVGFENIYPFWRDVIVEFFKSGKNELILTGATGTGKSYCALQVLNRALYELSCYEYPAIEFNLTRSSSIYFFYLSVTQRVALKTGFGKFRRLIDGIEYYRENFPRNSKLDSILKFSGEKVIFDSGSNVRDFIGSDLYAIILDEADFVGESKEVKASYEVAKNIYRESTNRRKNRFIIDGVEHGVSIIVSSANTSDSFVEQRIQEVKDSDDVMVVSARKYDIMPENYCGRRFWVFVGDNHYPPFIVDDEREKLEYYFGIKDFDYDRLDNDKKMKFISVPVEYYNTFKLDIVSSLKEVAGISIDVHNLVYINRQIIDNSLLSGIEHPFAKSSFCVSTESDENELISNYISGVLDIDKQYVLGLDLSLTGDRTGVSLVSLDNNGNYEVDLMLAINPPDSPFQIDYMKIYDFIIYLVDKGVDIVGVGYDRYNSIMLVQMLEKEGFRCVHIGLDENDNYYLDFFNKFSAGLIKMYYYDIMYNELLNIYYTGKKFDHVRNGSKDVADAVCRAVSVIDILNIRAVGDNDVMDYMIDLLCDSGEDIIKREYKVMQNKLYNDIGIKIVDSSVYNIYKKLKR